jgi:hypothetical protein
MDEITTLKAELNDLNVKCQLARDNEIRFALQRSRLEAERAKLLVRIMEAVASTAAPAIALPTAPTPTAPYRVVVQAAPMTPLATPACGPDIAAKAHHPKPAGLPTMQAMVETVLQTAPKGMRPCDITVAIQKGWWPNVPRTHVSSVVWHMGQKGRLTKHGAIYRLPPAVQTNGHDC